MHSWSGEVIWHSLDIVKMGSQQMILDQRMNLVRKVEDAF